MSDAPNTMPTPDQPVEGTQNAAPQPRPPEYPDDGKFEMVDMGDGTYQPNEDLLKAVRMNPSRFPNAVADFAALSGRTEEEVNDIIANRDRAGGGGWDYKPVHWFKQGVEGVGEALGQATENVGQLVETATGSTAIKDFGQEMVDVEMDPGFDTEKDWGESATNIVGQIAPAVAGGIGLGAVKTGGWLTKFAVGVLGAEAVGTMTFDEKEDTVFQVIDDLLPEGSVKELFSTGTDWLDIHEGDDEDLMLAKQFAANSLLVGVPGVVGGKVLLPLLKALRRGDAEEAVDMAKHLADEAEQSTPAAVEAEKRSAKEQPEVAAETAKEDVETVIREGGEGVAKEEAVLPAYTEEQRKWFQQGVNTPVKHLARRLKRINSWDDISLKSKVEMNKFTDNVHAMVRRGDFEGVHAALMSPIKHLEKMTETDKYVMEMHRKSLVDQVAQHGVASSKEITELLRKDPSMRTHAAIIQYAKGILKMSTVVDNKLWEMSRAEGSLSSIHMLSRKGARKGEEIFGEQAEMDKLVEEWAEKSGIDGITLRDSKETFTMKRLVALDDANINSADALDLIQRTWDDFDKARQGKLADMGKAMKHTPFNEMSRMAQVVQVIKDLQGKMLLGQYATSGLEFVTSGFQHVSTPLMKVLGGGSPTRMMHEYAGHVASIKFAGAAFRKGYIKGAAKTTDHDILHEGAMTGINNYEVLREMKIPKAARYALEAALRAGGAGADLSIASSEFFKANKAFGIAYSEAYEVAKKSMNKKDAKEAALKAARSRFTDDGYIKDETLRMAAEESVFQQAWDGTTFLGKLGRKIDNLRNSEAMGGVGGLTMRAAMPFFKTLANVGSQAASAILPAHLTPFALKNGAKLASKVFGKEISPEGIARLTDDLLGKNGQAAKQVALGRQRVGNTLLMVAMGNVYSGAWEVTGPTRGKNWNSNKRKYEENPPSAVMVGDSSVDLTRFLPFSAPLLLAGTMSDYHKEDMLRMEGGEWGDDTTFDFLVQAGAAYPMTMMTMLADAGAAQGVMALMQAVDESVAEGSVRPMDRFLAQYGKQFAPGGLKMAQKAGMFGDQKQQYEAYTQGGKVAQAFGMNERFTRKDFFGNDIKYPSWKGIDPTNSKELMRSNDPVYQEFANLNTATDLALVLPKPHLVLVKKDWDKMGLNTGASDERPSLADMTVNGGKNAWDAFRELVYDGSFQKDKTVKVNDVPVLIKKGQTFEQTMRRLHKSAAYRQMSPEYKADIWTKVFGKYTTDARDYIKGNLVIDPSLFKGAKIKSPISGSTLLPEAKEAGKAANHATQMQAGDPLDENFTID